MLRLKNYIWIFLLATGIVAVVASNVCCTGKASNKQEAGMVQPTLTEKPASGSVIVLNESNFNDYTQKGVVLVDFWATWCRPCQMQGPVIEEVGSAMSGKATVCKLDVDKNPTITDRFSVQSIPTMIIFKDGKIVGKFLGYTAKESIIAELNKHIK